MRNFNLHTVSSFALCTLTLAGTATANDCAEIQEAGSFVTGGASLQYGPFTSSVFQFDDVSGMSQDSPLRDTYSQGYLQYIDINNDDMAFCWSVGQTNLTDDGVELSAFAYAKGRYTGLPYHHYGHGDAYGSAWARIEITTPTVMTLDMEVISSTSQFTNFDWGRKVQRLEWQDQGEFGTGYFPVQTLLHDRKQNFVENMNEYSEYHTGLVQNRTASLELQPGIYLVQTNTNVNAQPKFHGIVGSVQSDILSLCDISLECVMQRDGEMTGNSIIDGADLALFLAAWGSDSGSGDFNNDGIADGADLTLLLANWD